MHTATPPGNTLTQRIPGRTFIFPYTNHMKLIFAQGNHGTDYQTTRHNVGFTVLDALARAHSAVFQPKDKFKAHVAELHIDGDKVLLVKPQTYYNDTGLSARALVDFYKLDPSTDVLVVHDDLAIPFGTIRTRAQGSDAGNNGIKSLNAHLGPQYHRLRIGIWSEDRNRAHDREFVLGRFTPEETEQLPEIIAKAEQLIGRFIAGTLEATTL